MEENVLKSFETFDEFPDKYLKVDINSDYHYIKNKNNNSITKKNIDLITNINDEKVLIKCSYYDVISGSIIYNSEFISDINGTNKELLNFEDVKVISLANILNIKGNSVYYLTKEDVNILIKYKEKNSKTYNLTFKKNYF